MAITKFFNEMSADDGSVREHYAAYAKWLSDTPADRIARKRAEADSLFHRYGITGSTPTNIAEIGTAMGTAVKAFALGLTSSLIVPAMTLLLPLLLLGSVLLGQAPAEPAVEVGVEPDVGHVGDPIGDPCG